MATTAPTIDMLKAAMRENWTAGDFGAIARYEGDSGAGLVERLGLRAGDRVLDVACGTGNVALAAARAGARATGIDFAPNLFGAGASAGGGRQPRHRFR